MSDRLIVKTRTFTYPADAESLALIRRAGGLSKLPREQQRSLKWKVVRPGEFCDDMPAESVALRLQRGEIARVPGGAEE